MRFLPLVPAAFAILLYANTLGHGYVLDDPLVTTLHDHVQKGVAGIPAIVTTNFLNGVDGFNDGLYRPLVLVTFAVENQVFGNNPGLSHLVNVLLYAVAGTLLFLLLRSLFEDRHPWLSLLITLLWVSHPVHTEVVANLKGRDEILAFMNIVLSLLFLVRYARSGRMPGLVLGLGFFALAFLSKESAIPMVIGIPLTLWFFTRIPRTRLITVVASLGVLGGLLYGWREYVIGNMPVPMDEGIVAVMNNSVLSAEGSVERFSSGMFLQLLYLGKLIFPWSLAHDYSYNQIPPRGLMNPMTLLSIAVVIGLLAVAFRGLKSRSPYSFGICFTSCP